ncbi:tail fiber domain-containing protein [Porphyromonas asaccharolytica]|uniref:tail fiber domain-containing protein n=1 Tax=Porphyromonas asaccharolytica TaxID=28123 RepID=UPI00248D57F4|nr:tail fiber domain-containing protein [Porphyromonas asaccharolytica]
MTRKLTLLLLTLLSLVVTAKAQLRVRPDGSVHMGTTSITASSLEKDALLVVSEPGKSASSIGFKLDQKENPLGRIEFLKKSKLKELSMNFCRNAALVLKDYDDGQIVFRFQVRPELHLINDIAPSSLDTVSHSDIEELLMTKKGSGLDMRYDAQFRLFFEPMGYARIFSLGSSQNYWTEAYITQSHFKKFPIITSDQSAKENVEEIDEDEASRALLKLRPVTYTLKEDNANASDLVSLDKSNFKEQNHHNYGLIAQEVLEIFPDIVEYDTISQQYGIRYMELIPILIVALQRQQQEIETLKEHIGRSTESKYQPLRTATDISTPNDIASYTPKLWEAVPNPFSDQTSIAYYVPSEVTDAYIALLNLQGEMLESYPCTERGYKANVLISSDGLANGLYLYALIVDGVEVAMRKLVVKK